MVKIGHLINVVRAHFVHVLLYLFQSGQMAPFACLPALLGIKQQFSLHCNRLIRRSSIKLCEALKAFSCIMKFISKRGQHVCSSLVQLKLNLLFLRKQKKKLLLFKIMVVSFKMCFIAVLIHWLSFHTLRVAQSTTGLVLTFQLYTLHLFGGNVKDFG